MMGANRDCDMKEPEMKGRKRDNDPLETLIQVLGLIAVLAIATATPIWAFEAGGWGLAILTAGVASAVVYLLRPRLLPPDWGEKRNQRTALVIVGSIFGGALATRACVQPFHIWLCRLFDVPTTAPFWEEAALFTIFAVLILLLSKNWFHRE
jgi:hypothetical protein